MAGRTVFARGFTLVELLVTFAVLAAALGAAAASFAGLVKDNHLAASANRLRSALALARREAVSRHTPVVICPSGSGTACQRGDVWTDGWIAFTDPDNDRRCVDGNVDGICDSGRGLILNVATAVTHPRVTVTSQGPTAMRVVFRPTGYSAGYMGTFSICDDRGEQYAHALVLVMSGRVRAGTDATANIRCP